MEFLDTDYVCSIIVYDAVSSSLNQNASGWHQQSSSPGLVLFSIVAFFLKSWQKKAAMKNLLSLFLVEEHNKLF